MERRLYPTQPFQPPPSTIPLASALYSPSHCTTLTLDLRLTPRLAFPKNVGYTNTEGDQGTYKLMGASFFAVGNANKEIGLSTLKITGYENTDYCWDAGSFNASFQILNGDGSPARSYVYYNESDGSVWFGATWKDEGGAEITSDNEVWLKEGDGLWLTMPGDYEVDSLALVSAGQVFAGDYGVECDQGTYKAICNPFPATVKLSQCEIQGYENTDYCWDAGSFNASFQILNGDGSPARSYVYYNESDGAVWYGATWKDEGGAEITSDNDVDIPAGQGLWLTMPGDYEADCLSMVFPKVLDK